HPVEVSPLAKRMDTNPNFVERYQIILAGSEMGNGYSELNDPIDQEQRFKKQQKMRENGDLEAQMEDNDFVMALEYGMPPVTGFGVSERLFSFLANLSIRETVMFPLLRPEK
ncbi:MAG: amino acid--tRNA ligase-related protein, partial [Patescibacteria group bacterium]